MTLWEIFNRCATDPYPGLTNQQVKEIVKQDGIPMTPPDKTPPLVATIMEECFNKAPENRPTFVQILKRLAPTEDTTQYETKKNLVKEKNSTESMSTSTQKKEPERSNRARKTASSSTVRKNSRD